MSANHLYTLNKGIQMAQVIDLKKKNTPKEAGYYLCNPQPFKTQPSLFFITNSAPGHVGELMVQLPVRNLSLQDFCESFPYIIWSDVLNLNEDLS